jgi:thiamine kinase-like enzyme
MTSLERPRAPEQDRRPMATSTPSPDSANSSNPPEDVLVAAVRSAVPDLQGATATTSLSGGITNRNYRVDTPRGAFVVRIGSPSAEQLGIHRAHEHASSLAAAHAGVGADVIAFLPSFRAIVTRFLDGRVLTADDIRHDPSTLRRVALAVRTIHQGSHVPGAFSPFDAVRDYHTKSLALGVPMPDAMPAALDRLRRIELEIGGAFEPRPCHNDLLPANLLDDGERVRIIDWEYAGMGDPFFDLGNLAVNSQLDEPGERALLEIYAGHASDEHLRRLRLMRLASDMRESLWGFLQAGISSLDFDFLGYGRTHLDRFLALSS